MSSLSTNSDWSSSGTNALPAVRRAYVAWGAWALGSLIAYMLWQRGFVFGASGWYGASLLMLIAAIFGKPWLARLGLFFSVLLLAGGFFTARILVPSPTDLSLLLLEPESTADLGSGLESGSIVMLEGMVLDTPAMHRAGGGSGGGGGGALASYSMLGSTVGFTLSVKRARLADATSQSDNASDETQTWRAVTGRVRVAVHGGMPDIKAGDALRVLGMAHAIEPPSNPGESDARLWARQDHLTAHITVASPSLIVPIDPKQSRSLQVRMWRAGVRLRARLRARSRRTLATLEDSPRGQVLASLLLGERENDSFGVRRAFANIGLAHVLAISGFHLAILAMSTLFFVRLFGDRGRLEPIIVACLVLLYITILPARAPILRAAIMVLAWLVSMAMGRRYDKRALLAWVALVVLIARPMDIFSLGYQLTFGITATLIWFGQAFHARLFPAQLTFIRYEPPDIFSRTWFLHRTARLLSASILCWAVATPLVASRVGIFSPAAVPATMIVIPLVIVLLIAGYIGLVVGSIAPATSLWIAAALAWLASVLLWVVGMFDTLPFATIHLPALSLGLSIALTWLVLFWLLKGRLESIVLWLATLVCTVWLTAELTLAGQLPASVVLRIDGLDVGDGTCLLVRSGREAVLWDCGSLWPAIGRSTIPRAVRALGAWHVRSVVITHPNFDHYSGLLDSIEPLGIERVYLGQAFLDQATTRPDGPAAALLAGLSRKGVPVLTVARNDSLQLGEAQLVFLSPARGARHQRDNDDSLVAMIRVKTSTGTKQALLTGDIEKTTMAELVASEDRTMAAHTPNTQSQLLRADILELPHHGSLKPAALAFVDRVNPKIVLQSTGPARATTVGWNAQRMGRIWWTTAFDGQSWVTVRRDGSMQTGSLRTALTRSQNLFLSANRDVRR